MGNNSVKCACGCGKKIVWGEIPQLVIHGHCFFYCRECAVEMQEHLQKWIAETADDLNENNN